MERVWRKNKFKNLTLVAIFLLFALALSVFEPFHEFLLNLGDWGYVGAVIAGAMFVSTFTVGIATVILLVLAEQLHILELGILAGFGGVLGDLIVFQFVKTKGLTKEINLLVKKLGGQKLKHLLHTKYFRWWLPVFGAILIASPIPDEFGVSLLGLSKISTPRFMFLTFTLNTIGVTAILAASNYIKP